MKTTEALVILKNNPKLEGVPESQLNWLLEKGTITCFEEGEFLFKKDQPADYLTIILSGKLRLYLQRQNSTREMGTFGPHDVTGVLPFSRLRVAVGFAQVLESSEVFQLHRDHFPEMIANHYDLTEKFVHLMTSRVREFTSQEQQNEKMMALGKLSAGLAHELNNPAAAIVRSSDSLIKHLKNTPEKFKEVISMNVTGSQVDRINAILFAHLTMYPRKSLSMKEKMNLEEDFQDWLDDHEINEADDIADNLVEYGFILEDLQKMEEILEKDALDPVLNWINNVLTTERTVADIHEASKRISELVQSVKSYSHMDRTQEKVKTDIHNGINDTLKLLSHKIKSGKVSINTHYDTSLPEVLIFPGQLNQVWTNIIDNAIDALEGISQPAIDLHTRKENGNAVIEISDNGTGIPEDVKNRIFDPFYTTKDVGKGSGMGLDISRKIIQSHHGKISVESKKNQTTFRIQIPFEQ